MTSGSFRVTTTKGLLLMVFTSPGTDQGRPFMALSGSKRLAALSRGWARTAASTCRTLALASNAAPSRRKDVTMAPLLWFQWLDPALPPLLSPGYGRESDRDPPLFPWQPAGPAGAVGSVRSSRILLLPACCWATRPGAEDKLPLPRFASLQSSEVNMRAGPGETYPIMWTYQRAGLPVEIIEEFDIWRRIRDHDGVVGWVKSTLLVGKRHVIVRDEQRPLRKPGRSRRPAGRPRRSRRHPARCWNAAAIGAGWKSRAIRAG